MGTCSQKISVSKRNPPLSCHDVLFIFKHDLSITQKPEEIQYQLNESDYIPLCYGELRDFFFQESSPESSQECLERIRQGFGGSPAVWIMIGTFNPEGGLIFIDSNKNVRLLDPSIKAVRQITSDLKINRIF